eukprot:Awhi_evm1s14508
MEGDMKKQVESVELNCLEYGSFVDEEIENETITPADYDFQLDHGHEPLYDVDESCHKEFYLNGPPDDDRKERHPSIDPVTMG